jgi:hypothetical protein
VRTKLLLLAALGVGAGCEREPLGWICPSLDPGSVVVTELRGEQSGADTYGQWIELYNATAAAIDLEGAVVEVVRLDGGAEGRILVRDSLPVAAGAYAVLGRFAPGEEPDWVDYGYALDFASSLFDSGAIDVIACDVQVDRVVYHDLPTTGTLALDGAIDPPTATANDDEASWCPDQVDDHPDPTELGIRGTPGQGNRPCP